MTPSPPTHPGNANAGSPDDAALSVQEQLDRLLSQIETQEPGTLDPGVLPAGFISPAGGAKTNAAKDPGVDPGVDQAIAAFEEALDAPPESVLEQDPPEDRSPEPEPEPAAEPAAAVNSAEQDMLAALNAALKDLTADNEPEAEPAAQDEPVAAPAPAKTMEQQLQDEINALLNAPAQAEPEAEPTDEPAEEPVDEPPPVAAVAPAASALVADEQEPEPSTQDQIASEIQNLLDANPEPDEDHAEPDADDPSIDELDRMLAEEIDEDGELVGDFQSVEAITAGIKTPQDDRPTIDEHAATARDVAAELDSQPEDRLDVEPPAPQRASATEQAPQNTEQTESIEESTKRGWRDWLAAGRAALLSACFAVNWPARRFLSTEWRANLGYVALLNLFLGLALCLYLIIR